MALSPINDGDRAALVRFKLNEIITAFGAVDGATLADMQTAQAATEVAATAVTGAAADIDSLKSRLPGPFSVEQLFNDIYSHAIVSENGLVLALIEKATGKWVLSLSDNAEIPFGNSLAGVTFTDDLGFSGYLAPIRDTAGNLLGGWKSDGTFKAKLSDDSTLPEGLLDAEVAALLSAPAYQNGGKSGPGITCIGDSLTASAGASSSATRYPAVVGTLSGRTVTNLGVGGESARTIAGRVGGWPYMVMVADGSIPASGGVTVTLLSLDGQAVAPLLQGNAGLNPCFLAGVEGTLTLNTGVYTFTRTAAGSAVTVKHPIALVTEAFRNRMGDILILDIGQNGGFADDAQLIAMHDAIFAAQNRAVNLGLVLGRTSGTVASRASLHDAMQRRYGPRFVNVLAYLSSYAALERAGVTPTSEDDTAIANGSLPPSFWLSGADSIHLNDAGYGQKAFIVHQRLTQLGWV